MTLADKLQAKLAASILRFGYASVMRSAMDSHGCTRSAEQDTLCAEIAASMSIHSVPGTMCVTFFPSLADYNRRGGGKRR